MATEVNLQQALTAELEEVEARFGPLDDQYKALAQFEVTVSDDELSKLESLHESIEAALELESNSSIGCYVVDLYCLKPLPSFELKKLFAETGLIVTVEAHVSWGGVYAAVSEHVPVKRALSISLPPTCGESTEKIMEFSCIDRSAIKHAVLEICK